MKSTLVKAIALFTLALSFLLAGAVAINTVDTGVAVCHDGPRNGSEEY